MLVYQRVTVQVMSINFNYRRFLPNILCQALISKVFSGRRDGTVHLCGSCSRKIMGVFGVPKRKDWVVVSNMFCVHPYLGKIPILTYIFLKGLKPPTSEEYIGNKNEIWKKNCLVFPTHFANLLLTILTIWFYNMFFFAKKNIVVPTSLHVFFLMCWNSPERG